MNTDHTQIAPNHLDPIAPMPMAAPGERHRVRPPVDHTSGMRNPAMGWVLYDDAAGEVARAPEYWAAQDKASTHASIFYVRWRWSDAEPEEGCYAWDRDQNFKDLIGGARDRGLRLAFRFYVASRDNLRQGTPDYVRRAGAAGVMENGQGGPLWSPFVDDPIFQAKYEKFIEAFGGEFDDPSRVDFVDGMGLGFWGEGHHMPIQDPARLSSVLSWVVGAFSRAFQKVLLGWQYHTDWGLEVDEAVAIKGADFVCRRDGLGSHWFSPRERKGVKALFPRHPLYGERCYWGGGPGVLEKALADKRFDLADGSWLDVDSAAVEDALAHHANTLDLRTVPDAARFMEYPELVGRFERSGGYRLAPVEVDFSGQVGHGQMLSISHRWANFGVGVLPNLNRRWGGKYRVSFAFLSSTGVEKVRWVSGKAEPGIWVGGEEYIFHEAWAIPVDLEPGQYRLAVGILNTRPDGAPHLKLALKENPVGPWYPLGTVVIGPGIKLN